MPESTKGDTRQRLIDEAIQLFATNGYTATSVADIQLACGLTAGSGALYKHFSSKRELLEAAVHRHFEAMADTSRAVVERRPESGRAALHRIATAAWEVIDKDRQLIRIMLHEFDRFPELFERMWLGVVASVYQKGAEWIRTESELGNLKSTDPEASAAVLLASLTYYPLLRTLIPHTPGDIDPDRFLAAWTEHAANSLQLRE